MSESRSAPPPVPHVDRDRRTVSDSGGDPIIEPTADPTAAESVRVESNTAVALLWAVMQGAGELASLPVLARSRQNAADALHESQAQRRIDPGGDPAED